MEITAVSADHGRRRLFALCFFLSGAAGLIDEVVWSRYLHLIFGSTSHSIAVVIATYMAGLGLGAWLFGRIADRVVRPARLYAWLELGVGAYALLSPWLVGGVQRAFVHIHRLVEPGELTATLIRVVLAVFVLLVPTVLMGGTLPLLARELMGSGTTAAQGVGLLYGLNTLGAVAGALFAGFVSVERIGLLGSLAIAAGLNVVAAIIVLAIPARTAASPVTSEAGEMPGTAVLPRASGFGLVLALSLSAGLASLMAEVAWTRLLSLIIGSSTWSFALVLAGFLLGIGLGSYWIGSRGTGELPLARLGWAQLLAALGVGSVLYGLVAIMRVFTAFQQNPLAGFGLTLSFKALLVFATVLPATVGMGMSFPLLAAAAGRDSKAFGSTVGLVYAANTVGAIAGSVLAGFSLLVSMGTFTTLKIAALVHVLVAGGAFLLARQGLSSRRVAVAGLALLFSAVVVGAARPWPSHMLNLGLFLYPRGTIATRLELDRYFQRGSVEQVESREGLSSVISVWDIDYSRGLRNNGKTDAGTGGDMDTQVNLALRPLVVHPAPRRVLVIGAGSGVTAATVGIDPGIERIDLVEIESAVITAGPLFVAANRGIYNDPRLRVIVGDGRNHLLTTTERYDIIISEPSNPWMAGVSNLFTHEFYELVRSRLAPDGVFCQWLQQYHIRPEAMRRIAATLLRSFPETEAWVSGFADMQLLASQAPLRAQRARAATLLAAQPEFARSLGIILNLSDVEDLLVGRLLDTVGVRAFAGELGPYRDDPPELEFDALRSLGEHAWSARVQRELLAVYAAHPPGRSPDSPPGFDAYSEGRLLQHYNDGAGAQRAFASAAEAALAQQAPGATKYLLWLGDVAQIGGNTVLATAAWGQALELEPGSTRVLAHRAEAQLRVGNAAGALADLAAIGEADRDSRVRVLEAEGLALSGQSGAALARLREVVSGLSQSPDAQRTFARVRAIYRRLGENPGLAAELIRDLESHAGTAPRVLAWALLLGEINERERRFDPALEWYTRALSGGPDAAALAGRARTLLALGRRDESLAALALLRGYEPWSADVYRMDQALATATASR